MPSLRKTPPSPSQSGDKGTQESSDNSKKGLLNAVAAVGLGVAALITGGRAAMFGVQTAETRVEQKIEDETENYFNLLFSTGGAAAKSNLLGIAPSGVKQNPQFLDAIVSDPQEFKKRLMQEVKRRCEAERKQDSLGEQTAANVLGYDGDVPAVCRLATNAILADMFAATSEGRNYNEHQAQK